MRLVESAHHRADRGIIANIGRLELNPFTSRIVTGLANAFFNDIGCWWGVDIHGKPSVSM